MFGLHVLLAASLAAFADALSPLGVVLSFFGIHLLLSLGAGFLGLKAYVERVRLGTRFIGWFLVEILKASLDVARVVLGARVRPEPAILSLSLARRDDRIATLIGGLLTLTPGTLALDYDAARGVMLVHVLDARSADAVEAGIRGIESRLLRWIDAGQPCAGERAS